ncbi:MAG: PhzF family phenazine biosynthesis protein [Methanosarcina sp.]
MNSQQIIYQVDAFANEPFRGNPAGVCIMENEPSIQWMQNIAMEMNLSETAFVFPKDGKRAIRYYTPASEIKLCGHATLSASHIMYEQGFAAENEEIVFSSKAGELTIKKEGSWITMNFPAYPLTRIDAADEFTKMTGLISAEIYEAGEGWTLAVMKNETEIRNAAPVLATMKHSRFNDLIITAPSDDPKFDFCVRCFAPGVGIDEDPVTGSAHCALAPFWSEKTGKNDFVSHQVSRREGVLKVSLKGNRVSISGQAVTVFKAELYIKQ